MLYKPKIYDKLWEESIHTHDESSAVAELCKTSFLGYFTVHWHKESIINKCKSTFEENHICAAFVYIVYLCVMILFYSMPESPQSDFMVHDTKFSNEQTNK